MNSAVQNFSFSIHYQFRFVILCRAVFSILIEASQRKNPHSNKNVILRKHHDIFEYNAVYIDEDEMKSSLQDNELAWWPDDSTFTACYVKVK